MLALGQASGGVDISRNVAVVTDCSEEFTILGYRRKTRTRREEYTLGKRSREREREGGRERDREGGGERERERERERKRERGKRG